MNLEAIMHGMIAQDIKEALDKIWNSPEMAKQMGKKGRERVEKLFSWQKVSKDIENIFQEVISK